MRWWKCVLATVPLLAQAAAVAADGSDLGLYVGKPVSAVVLEVEGRPTTDPRVRALIETAPGKPLSIAEVRESVAHLFNLGRYEDVRVHAALSSTGVALRYELVPVHTISSIAFSGLDRAPGVREKTLRRAIDDRVGRAPRLSRTADITTVVEDVLRQAGYMRPAVSVRVRLVHQPERATVTLSVEPGARTRIGRIDVAGITGANVETDRARLLKRLRLTSGAPYERDALAARVEAYVAERRGRGYYDSGLTVTPTFADDDRTVHLALNANEGTRARVVFAGDPAPDRADVLVPLSREGVLDEDLLEDATLRIEERLRALGFRDATAPYVRERTDNETVVTFTIRRGGEYRVAQVDIIGNVAVPTTELSPQVRLVPGAPFSSEALDAAAAAIVESYRRRGFAEAKVEATTTLGSPASSGGPTPVAARLRITEGARTTVGSVRIEGNVAVRSETLTEALGLRPGRPFFLNQMAVDRDAIQLQYANQGYVNASVEGNPGLSADRTRADVVFTVREGARTTVDHVLIVGNVRISTDVIERELQLKAGDPLGLAAVAESQRRLSALGLFRRTRLTSVGHGDATRRDLIVTVEEAPVTTIGYGGGVEVEPRTVRADSGAVQELQFAPRAFFETGRRNLFGKNRSVNVFTGVSVRTKPQETGTSGYGPNEYRVLGTYREPRLFGTTADGLLTVTVEQQIRSSFNFARQAFGADISRRITRGVNLSGSYRIQRTELKDLLFEPKRQDRINIDRVFPQIRLSSFSSSAIHDTRDDVLDPGLGHYASVNGEIGGRAIGSEVGFAKSFFTAQIFRRLPRVQRAVVATSARLGLAAGFPQLVTSVDESGTPVTTQVRDLPAAERFFAGGDTTVRGFSLDQLGTPATIDKDGFPIGGNALVIFNAELRLPVRGGLGLVGFVDTGNVFARTTDLNLGQLRTAVGFGVRYRSPIGPVRFDVGFKVHRQEITAGRREDLTALHISLGQAF